MRFLQRTISIFSITLVMCSAGFTQQSEAHDEVLAEKREAFGMATRDSSTRVIVHTPANVIVPEQKSSEPVQKKTAAPASDAPVEIAPAPTPEVSIREVAAHRRPAAPLPSSEQQQQQNPVEAEEVDNAPVGGLIPTDTIDPEQSRPDRIALLTDSSERPVAENQPIGNSAISIVSTVGKLVLVCALAYLVLLVLKQIHNRRDAVPSRTRDLQVLEMVRLSPNNSLHLLEIEGKKLLIGCSTNQVNLLQEIDVPETPEPASQPDNRFAEYLAKYSEGSTSDNPTGRISGLLRDCAGYLRQRCAGASKPDGAIAGEKK